MAILADRGAVDLKIGPLCRRVGVTSGSFYHHFGGWSAFVEALLADWEAKQTHDIGEVALAASSDPYQRLDLLIGFAAGLPHRSEAAIRAWASRDPAVDRCQRRVDAARIQIAVAAVRAVGVAPADADRLASIGLSLIIGHQMLGRDQEEMAAAMSMYKDLILGHVSSTNQPMVAGAVERG